MCIYVYVGVYKTLGALHIQRTLCKAAWVLYKAPMKRGFAHTYTHFGIFLHRCRWLLCKTPLQRSFAKPLGVVHIQRGFVPTYIHTCAYFLFFNTASYTEGAR